MKETQHQQLRWKMPTSNLTKFDAEVARRVDDQKLPGFGAPQAGMVRRIMFGVFAEQIDEDPIAAVQAFLHMVELERDR